jgi:hypothetical protein
MVNKELGVCKNKGWNATCLRLVAFASLHWLRVLLSLLVDRCFQGFFNRPSTVDAIRKSFWMQPKFVSPVSKAHSSVSKGDDSIAASVAQLLTSGCPYAITRGIPMRVVCSFYSVFVGRSRSHGCVKRFKRTPFIAYGNSSSSVVIVLVIRRIFAALSHCVPCVVFCGTTFSVSGNTAASATTTSSASHCCTRNYASVSTFAQAVPVSGWRLMVNGLVYNSPFAKLLTSQVYEAWAWFFRILISHAKSLIQVSCGKVQRGLRLPSVPFYCNGLTPRGQFNAS